LWKYAYLCCSISEKKIEHITFSEDEKGVEGLARFVARDSKDADEAVMVERILIVDDSPVARKILKSCIPADQGYVLYEADDGTVGLERFKEISPSVTFLDITMARMDGLQCLEQIKKVNPEAVVVMCTADIQPKSAAKAEELGAFTLIKKPPSKDAVREVLLQVEKHLAQGA
jgi:two-component system, chemotaxis family, chemotaxis protein CheY